MYGNEYRQPYVPPPPPPPPAYSRMITMGVLAVGLFAVSLGAQWIVHMIDLVELDAIEMREVPSWVAPTEQILSALSALVRLVGLVLFLIWVHGVVTNTSSLGRTGMTITPGWAVGWFFIPIASLYMPYKAISEVASCSDPRGTAITPASVGVWWFAFVGGNVLRTVGNGMRQFIGVETHLGLEIVATILLTGAAAALLRVVLTIHRGQEEIRATFGR